ncbi:MAG TPA: hypothetical protein VJM33_11835 [Microthrixaceae bacterium]|nr:hypothetical protein [Microthrixaceae bacterium]
MEEEAERGAEGFWTGTRKMIAAVAALITAAATLLGSLTAAGVLAPSPAVSTSPAPSSVTLGTVEAAISTDSAHISAPTSEPSSELASIDLAYTDEYCPLFIEVRIADQQVRPTGSRYTLHDIAIGSQSYEIGGLIECLDGSAYEVAGSGAINVRDGATYQIVPEAPDPLYGVVRVTLAG